MEQFYAVVGGDASGPVAPFKIEGPIYAAVVDYYAQGATIQFGSQGKPVPILGRDVELAPAHGWDQIQIGGVGRTQNNAFSGALVGAIVRVYRMPLQKGAPLSVGQPLAAPKAFYRKSTVTLLVTAQKVLWFLNFSELVAKAQTLRLRRFRVINETALQTTAGNRRFLLTRNGSSPAGAATTDTQTTGNYDDANPGGGNVVEVAWAGAQPTYDRFNGGIIDRQVPIPAAAPASPVVLYDETFSQQDGEQPLFHSPGYHNPTDGGNRTKNGFVFADDTGGAGGAGNISIEVWFTEADH